MDWLEYLNWSEMQTDELRSIGFAYLKEGIYDLALVFFEALNVLEADNSEDLQTLGALHLQKGDEKKALKYIDRSLQIKNDPIALLNRVKVLFKIGQKDEAIQEARILLKSENLDIAFQAQALLMAFKEEPKA